MIKTIRDSILTRLGTLLTTFKKMSFVYEISENKFNGNVKRFGITSSSAGITEGEINFNTLDHKFEVYLTDTYMGPSQQLNDDYKSDKVVELQDLCLTVYKDLQKYKNTISSNIIIVNNLDIGSPEFLIDEKIVIIRMAFNVKYKT